MEWTHLNNKELNMVDVTNKDESYIIAHAYGRIYMPEEVIEKILNEGLEKGDIFISSKVAAINAAKKTCDLIPLCHNIILSLVDVYYHIEENFIEAISTVKTKSQTGVEMEALTAVLVFLENIYDMCKGITKQMVISDVKLVYKSGGKSGEFIDTDWAIIKSINISAKKGTSKYSVDEAKLIEDYGVEGDAHAGGERQVSLLDVKSIDKMKQYQIEGLCFGKFAENITTYNLDVNKIKIGTKLKIGKNAIIQISQIGKKCHGAGCEIAKTAGVCIMPTEGMFAKVITGGIIRRGDLIKII